MSDATSRTRRLALSYLAVIMTLSLLFSGLIYGVTAAQLGRPLPSPQNDHDQTRPELPDYIRERIEERDRQAKLSIIGSLVALNSAMLGAGTWASFMLARRTLRPIEAAMQSQNQFISDASHELRTPLTALQTTNEVALRKKHLDDAKARTILEKNITEVDKLRSLTETLLSLTQLDDRPLTLSPLWLDAVVTDVAESMADVATARHITLDTNVARVQVVADQLALTQVLMILVDNAIKYSPEHTTISINLVPTKTEAVLHVSDEGIGMSPTDQAHIFDRFYRADAARTRTETSGHGLGLSIAQSLVRKQHGKLTVDSTLGKGSTFSVHLPLA